MKDLKCDANYWVKTSGYVNTYTAMYRNKEGSWRINIDDRTLFISDYKLELLYGKNCVVREFDKENDTILLKDGDGIPTILMEKEGGVELFAKTLSKMKESRQVQMLLDSKDGHDFIVNYYPQSESFDITYALVKVDEGKSILVDYPLVFFNTLI